MPHKLKEWKYLYLADVSLHPLKHLSLIFQSNIKISSFSDFITSQKPVGTNTIIEINDYNVHARGYNKT